MKRATKGKNEACFVTKLKTGDLVMVTSGGNSAKDRTLKGQTGKIQRLLPKQHRVVVEGVNMIKRHKKAMASNESSGIIEKEGSVHITNVMYYSEEFKRPFRLKYRTLEDGRKVRGFIHPESKKFEQIDV